MSAVTFSPEPSPPPARSPLSTPSSKTSEADRLCCEYAPSLPKLIEAPQAGANGLGTLPREGALFAGLEARKHLPMLRRVAQRILGCPEQAEDAAQDALVALWSRAEPPPETRGWLVKTVIHRSLHRRRTELRRRRWEDEAAVSATITCPLCDPEEEFAQRELLEIIEAALSALPHEHRAVIELRTKGLEYDEIARTLDLPIGTVRSRLNRARRGLREHLASHAG